jgi:hypothetical protein
VTLPLPRPLPDPAMLGAEGWAFGPAEGMDAFVRATFLDPASPLFIEEHEVLAQARIGYLWAAAEARDKNRQILGTAQLIRPPQKKWPSLRAYHQVQDWFGHVDFLITLSAPFCLEAATEAEYLALLDHELSHCRQDVDAFDEPKFSQDTGAPLWRVVGHDVEQFVGVVERWGADAAGVTDLVAAARRPPRFGDVDIRAVLDGCGTCRKAA